MTHSASAQTRKRVLIVSMAVCALILIGGVVFTVCMFLGGSFAKGELVRRLWYAVLCIAMIAAIFFGGASLPHPLPARPRSLPHGVCRRRAVRRKLIRALRLCPLLG